MQRISLNDQTGCTRKSFHTDMPVKNMRCPDGESAECAPREPRLSLRRTRHSARRRAARAMALPRSSATRRRGIAWRVEWTPACGEADGCARVAAVHGSSTSTQRWSASSVNAARTSWFEAASSEHLGGGKKRAATRFLPLPLVRSGDESPPLQGEGWVGMVSSRRCRIARRACRRKLQPQNEICARSSVIFGSSATVPLSLNARM